MLHINYCSYQVSNADYDRICRPNGSGDYLFLYFITPMKVYFQQKCNVSKEFVFLIYSPGVEQNYQAVKKFKNSYIHFTDTDGYMKELELPLNQLFYLNNHEALNGRIKELELEFIKKDYLYEQQLDALLKQFFIALSRELHSTHVNTGTDNALFQQFQEARIHILTHLNIPWTNESMASLTNLSKSQFYHCYQTFFHNSPKAELLDARMEKAKYLLTNDALQISQVAEQSGFVNLSHFSRYFKKTCGCSPLEYAKNASKQTKVQ